MRRTSTAASPQGLSIASACCPSTARTRGCSSSGCSGRCGIPASSQPTSRCCRRTSSQLSYLACCPVTGSVAADIPRERSAWKLRRVHDRLRFVAGDLADVQLPPAGVVRCCNMLLYFDRAFRNAALAQLADLLEPNGMLVCGTDWALTTEARYFTYRKRNNCLSDCEFTFSLDNVAPLGMVPWYTLHDDDAESEMLTGMVGILRADHCFVGAFIEASNAIRAELGLPPRGSDAYDAAANANASPAELWT